MVIHEPSDMLNYSQMISVTRVALSTLSLTFFTIKVAIWKEKGTQFAIRKESCHAWQLKLPSCVSKFVLKNVRSCHVSVPHVWRFQDSIYLGWRRDVYLLRRVYCLQTQQLVLVWRTLMYQITEHHLVYIRKSSKLIKYLKGWIIN